jgi:hypothetical protein
MWGCYNTIGLRWWFERHRIAWCNNMNTNTTRINNNKQAYAGATE